MRPANTQENRVQMSDQELCEEMARRFNVFKNRGFAGGRHFAPAMALKATVLISNIGAFAMLATGILAPIAAPILAVDALVLGTVAREYIRPELRNKRLAYKSVGHSLGIETPELPTTIPFTKQDREMGWIKTLIKIGNAKEGFTGEDADKKIREINKKDREFINLLKRNLVKLQREEEEREQENQKMGNEDSRAASQSVFNPIISGATATATTTAATPSATTTNPNTDGPLNYDPNRRSLTDGARES